MMNKPQGSDYHTKIKAASYPVVEIGDLVWAYLRPEEKRPPEPKFEWIQVLGFAMITIIQSGDTNHESSRPLRKIPTTGN